MNIIFYNYGFVVESLVRLFGNQQILVLDITRLVEAICEGKVLREGQQREVTDFLHYTEQEQSHLLIPAFH